MKKIQLLVLAAAVAASACSDSTPDSPLAPPQPELGVSNGGTVRVTNDKDAGNGSFRAAVERANGQSSVIQIEFRDGLGPINLVTPVIYTGAQALTIQGNGAELNGAGLGATAPAAFLANGGGDLNVARLTVRNAPQEGLAYEVPATSTGTRKVVLVGVQIIDNKGHGVLINDQADPVNTANANGSDASLEVVVIGGRITGNGFGALDRDGLRINEGGLGNLTANISLLVAEGNGADGIELDERGLGDAGFTVSGSRINGNGSFDLPNTTATQDLDDGMDVDESGEGSLIGKVFGSVANDNYEEGWDFNENDLGDFRVEMTLAEASRNYQEGFDFEEDDDFAAGDGRTWGGDLYTTLTGIKADGNGLDPRPAERGDAGLKIRERFDGNITATIKGSQTNGNVTGGISVREQENGDNLATIENATAGTNGLAGILVREQDAGNLSSTIDQATTDANLGRGIDFNEAAAGDLTATVSRSTSTNNGGAGFRASQATTGVGTLTLITVTYSGNLAPEISTSGVTATEIP